MFAVKYCVWDEAKNQSNIVKYGIDFVDAPLIFQAPMLIRQDTRYDYGEPRWQGIGMLKFHVVVVIYSEPTPQHIRIISIRKAAKHEATRYRQNFAN